MQSPKRPQWTSRLGFIFSAAGAAIGLGNLQRFPQVAGEHGGGAFLLLYLGCVVLFGWPLMLAELAQGRAARTNPIKSFTALVPKRPHWRYAGLLGALVNFFITAYYVVPCAWILAFALKGAASSNYTRAYMGSHPLEVLPHLLLFHGATTFIVSRGLNKGVERFSKIVMPALLVIQVLLVIRILLLKGSWAGLTFYLKPNFTQLRGDSFLRALSQAFFSLCVGETILITYGSFSKKSSSLPSSAGYICALDTSVAFLAGLIIFPAAFLLGQDPQQGPTLIFNVLANLFHTLPGQTGPIVQVAYFSMLTIAGLTTCVTHLEVASHTLHQQMHWPKRACVWGLSAILLACSVPCIYSFAGSESIFSNWQLGRHKGGYAIMEFIWSDVGMVLGGLLTTLFVGWIWGARHAAEELALNAPRFARFSGIWQLHIKWIAPSLIATILLATLLR